MSDRNVRSGTEVGSNSNRFSSPPPLWERTPKPLWVELINSAGAGIRRFGARWPKLSTDDFMNRASRKAKLTDFSDERFREGLDVLIDAFEHEDTAHSFGRIFFREYCVSLLVNRLKIQADLTRYPEILDVPVRRPLFITGLPRSGTTFLHRLMSEDPAGRSMRFWESLEPSPSPQPSTYLTDPRIARATKSMNLLYKLSPRLATAHEFAAESPEEDNNLFAHDFGAGILGFMFDAPNYMRWLDTRDLVPGYQYHRKQLQLLSWKMRADYWILKAPPHLFGLDALLSVYPDANIVVIHRDPLQVMPSICSLAAGFRGMLTDRVDLRKLGEEFVEALPPGTKRSIAARKTTDPARIYDVRYTEMTSDPLGTIRAICDHFDYDFNSEYESRTRRYLAENPQHKNGVHRYKLEDFGLDAGIVKRHFAGYYAWLGERMPQPV